MPFIFILFLICAYLVLLLRVVVFFIEAGNNSNSGFVLGIVTFLAGIFIPLHIFLCSNVWWYGEKVVPPEISIKLRAASSWLTNSELEPLLGEEITQDAEGNYFVTLTDHRLHSDDADKTPDLEISLVPENATLKKAKATLTITELAAQNPPSWYDHNTANMKDQTTVLDQNFQYTIHGSKIRFNENPDIEPTTFRITAENKRGKTAIKITITRYPLYKACELYNQNHPESSAVVDIPLCKARADYSEQHRTSGNDFYDSENSSHNPNNANQPTSTAPTCLHYEAGRCWDDLELEAYGQGQYDKLYGNYGDSYYGSDDCDNFCESILEDAYDEGYNDY